MAKKSSNGTSGIGMAAGMNAPTKPSPEQIKMDQQYRAEDDLRTLHRARQIVTDKPRHAAARQHAKDIFTAASAPGVSVSGRGSGKTYGSKAK